MKSFIIAAIAAFSMGVMAAPASPMPSAVDGTYQATVLKHHNVHRANHSASDLTWGPHMAAYAIALASTCSFGHDTTIGGGGYGQNIAAGTPPADISTVITDEMYNAEMPYYSGEYGLDNPSFSNFERWGHFSQIVWAGTKHVGCYTYDCSATGLSGVSSDVEPYFTVCNYWPAGNMGGEYGDNIGEPQGDATVYSDY